MRVTLFRGLHPHVLEGDFTAVVVEAESGTPLSVTSEYQPGVYQAKHFQDPGFAQTLRNLGLDRTTVFEERPGPKLADMGL